MAANNKKIGFADLRVGLLLLLSMGILIAVILTISGDIDIFHKYLIIRTKLSEVDGLRVGTEVRLAGVHIGQVSEVRLLNVAKDQEAVHSVEVVMKIDNMIDGVPAQQRIRSDSVVRLGSVGLLGDKVIDITPGTEKGTAVANDGVIKGSEETSIKQLITGTNDILANFTLLSGQLKEVFDDINQGKGTVGLLIKDERLYNNLNKTVVESQELVKRVREGDGTVGKLLNDPQLYNQIQSTTNRIENLIADISNGRGTIGKLATDDEVYTRTTKILERLDNIAIKLDETAGKIDQGNGTISKLLNDDHIYQETESTLANLNKVSARIDRISAELEKGNGSAGKLLQDPELYNNFNSASSEVVKLLHDFRQDPKKYLTIKVRIF